MILLLLTAALAQSPTQSPPSPQGGGNGGGNSSGQAGFGGQQQGGGGGFGGQQGFSGQGGQGGQGGQPGQGGQGGQPGQGGQGGRGGQPGQGGQGGQPGQGGQGGQPGQGGQGGQQAQGLEGAAAKQGEDMTRYGPPFILRLVDPAGVLTSTPLIRLGTGADALDILPKDDGQPPDVKAEDGIWSVVVDLYPSDTSNMLLLDGEQELLSFQFEIDRDAKDPALVVTLKEGGGEVSKVNDDGGDVDASVEVVELRSPNRTSSQAGPMGSAGGVQEGSSVAILSVGVFMAGGLLGVALTFLRLRAGPAGRVRPVGPGPSHTGEPGEPSGRGNAQIWIGPQGDDALVAGAALWAATWGPVLLVPDPAHRTRLVRVGQQNPHVHWLPDDQPEPGEALTARGALPGAAAIVVDGASALVPPTASESPTAPLEELCAHPSVIVVLGPDDAVPPGLPVFRFEPHPDGGFQLQGGHTRVG